MRYRARWATWRASRGSGLRQRAHGHRGRIRQRGGHPDAPVPRRQPLRWGYLPAGRPGERLEQRLRGGGPGSLPVACPELDEGTSRADIDRGGRNNQPGRREQPNETRHNATESQSPALAGPNPAALGNLGSLQQLNLHTNNLSGVDPVAAGQPEQPDAPADRRPHHSEDGNRGNIGLFGCVPATLRNATDADDLALAGANGISICP